MPEKATDSRKKIIDAISWAIFTRAERAGHTTPGAFSAHATFVSYARSVCKSSVYLVPMPYNDPFHAPGIPTLPLPDIDSVV